MGTTGQSLSPIGQAEIRPFETAPRPAVGFAMDYPAGLSFRQWRHQARMTEAMGALTTGATPAKAAIIAGYASQPARSAPRSAACSA